MKEEIRLPAFFLLLLLFCIGCEWESTVEPVRQVRAMKVADVTSLTGRSFPGRAEATQENVGAAMMSDAVSADATAAARDGAA